MSWLYVNDYLSTLNQQISGSVDRIKYKSGRFSADNVSSSRESFENTERYQSLNGYAYRLLETGMSYRLTALNSEQPQTADAGYAACSYMESSRVSRKPTVLIDFMFANNREFDFKV